MSERIYVITGSASGIGRATVEYLGRTGARVIGVDRWRADVIVDLGDPLGRRAIVDEVARLADGRVDGVIAHRRHGSRPYQI